MIFFNIDFQRSKGGLMFSGKYHSFTYVSSEMYFMTKCGKSGIKVVYNYKNKKYIITMDRQNVVKVPHPDLWSHKSLMQQLLGCQMGHSGTRWVKDQNEVSIPLHGHNHANLQETEKLYLENTAPLIWNIDV